MKKAVFTTLVLMLLVISLLLLPGSNVTASEDEPPTFDTLSADLVAKSYDHVSIVTTLQSGSIARLILKIEVPGFTGIAGLEGAAEADAMAKIDSAQRDFADTFGPDLTADMVSFDYIPFVSVWVESLDEYAALLASPMVLSAQQDIPVAADDLDLGEDPAPAAMAQAVPWISADDAHALGYDGDGWAVAILDTGVDKDHYFLDSGKVVSEACYSTTNSSYSSSSLCPGGAASSTAVNSAQPYNNGVCDDYDCDHGTHVAGIAAGTHTTFTGIAPHADLIAIQVFSAFNSAAYCGTSDPTCALSWTTDQVAGLERVYALRTTYDISSVNMSLGGGKYSSACNSDSRAEVIGNLKTAGIATVIATGNDYYVNGVSAPSCISDAIAVGATGDTNDLVTTFSNASPGMVDVWAPGKDITSSVPTEMYGAGAPTATWNGTSMATPMVAGAWAVFKEAYPAYSVDQVYALIDAFGVSVTDQRSGGSAEAPRIDFTNALLGTPGIPVLKSPANNVMISDSTPQFQWYESANATKYTFEIKKVSDNSVVTKTTYAAAARCSEGVCTIPSPVTLSLGIQYKWHVVAYNETLKGTWSRYWTFSVGSQSTLSTPILRSPGVDAIVWGGRPTFKWYPVTSANDYYVELYRGSDTSGTLIGSYVAKSPACSPYCEYRIPKEDDLRSNYGDYTWRVRAKNSTSLSDWSEPRNFNYTRLPYPTMISPTNDSSSDDKRPTFSWNTVDGAAFYNLQIRDTDDVLVLEEKVWEVDVCSGDVCTYEIVPLLAGGNYKWHVRAALGLNQGYWSEYWNFTVTGSSTVYDFDFNGTAPGWQDPYNLWYIYNSSAYRGAASSTCIWTCSTTYHNQYFTDVAFETSIRSTGTNGGDGLSFYYRAEFNPDGSPKRFYDLELEQSGSDTILSVYRYEKGEWYSHGGTTLTGLDITSYHTWAIVLDKQSAYELALYLDSTFIGGISVLNTGFEEGVMGVGVISYNPSRHFVDMNWATLAVPAGSAVPSTVLPDTYSTVDAPFDPAAHGLTPDGQRLMGTAVTDPMYMWQNP